MYCVGVLAMGLDVGEAFVGLSDAQRTTVPGVAT